MTIQIRKATRTKSKLRLGISAPSGAGKTMGSRFVFAIFRDPADVDDTYGDYAAVTDAGAHYEKDGFGSRQMLVK